MTGDGLSGRTAIAGIGQTEFSKESGRTELRLACEAVRAALDDAGVNAGDVDGLVTFTMDSSEEMEVARNLGIREVSMFTRVPYGGGAAAGTVMQAAMAVATGVAEVVVCYRAFNERSGNRFGNMSGRVGTLPLWLSWYAPYGLMTPAAWVALHARRYMHTYGVTNEDFGRIAVVDRKHAATHADFGRSAVVDRAHASTNPDAWFYERPITLEDHQASRWIVEPVLRLLDCCQESDGGVALVVTSTERARDLGQAPAVITAAAQGATFDGETMTSYYRDDLTGLPEMGVVGRRLWKMSGLTPAEISTAFLYDHFTPFVLMQLEELGFCGRGEAKDWATVERLSVGGELPINTSGGLLGEAYIHGMNGITEVVRQIRGTSCNQVANVEHALVTAGTGVPTSGLILTKA
jgi:acetyl-CoA acetyltransferase